MKQGFSLVELSIVLVILGLLIGGVLTGQNLIKAAELRAISEEYKNYQTAVNIFKDKYFGLPGDITNATLFWGKDNANCAAHTGTASVPGTCNGNADGLLGEHFRFWQQLAMAGLIEGNYSGTGNAGVDHVLGTNCPRSKMSNAGWGAIHRTFSAGLFTYPAVNTLQFGGQTVTGTNYGTVLRPEEAWNIDTKMDDGIAGSGKLISLYSSGTSCTTASGDTDYAAAYLLTTKTVTCALVFRSPF